MFAVKFVSLLLFIRIASIDGQTPIEVVMKKLIQSISDEQVRRENSFLCQFEFYS